MKRSFKTLSAVVLLVTPLLFSCGDAINVPEDNWLDMPGLLMGGVEANAAETSKWIGVNGGTLTSGPYTLTVPAGVFLDSMRFEIVPANKGSYALELHASKSSKRLHDEEVRFEKAVTIEISYEGADLPLDPSKLILVYVQGNGKTEPQVTTIDQVTKKATAQLYHFSRYALVQN